jgi:hypothetical protein
LNVPKIRKNIQDANEAFFRENFVDAENHRLVEKAMNHFDCDKNFVNRCFRDFGIKTKANRPKHTAEAKAKMSEAIQAAKKHISPEQRAEANEKRKATCFAKWGVEFASQSPKAKKKALEWNERHRAERSEKMKEAWASMPEAKKLARNKKISESHKALASPGFARFDQNKPGLEKQNARIFHFYLYEIFDLKTGKTYYGQRKLKEGKSVESDSPYMGSGSRLKEEYGKRGKDEFIKTVFHEGYGSKREIDDLEAGLIQRMKSIGKAEYNLLDGGFSSFNWWEGFSEEKKEEISLKTLEARGIANIGDLNEKFWRENFLDSEGFFLAEEARAHHNFSPNSNMMKWKRKFGMENNHHRHWNNPREEQRKKHSEAMKGEKNPFFGKSHSRDSRAKISAAKKGKPSNRKGVKMPPGFENNNAKKVKNRQDLNERFWRENFVKNGFFLRNEAMEHHGFKSRHAANAHRRAFSIIETKGRSI